MPPTSCSRPSARNLRKSASWSGISLEKRLHVGHLVEHEPKVGLFLEQLHRLEDVGQAHLQVFLAGLEDRPLPVGVGDDPERVLRRGRGTIGRSSASRAKKQCGDAREQIPAVRHSSALFSRRQERFRNPRGRIARRRYRRASRARFQILTPRTLAGFRLTTLALHAQVVHVEVVYNERPKVARVSGTGAALARDDLARPALWPICRDRKDLSNQSISSERLRTSPKVP